MVLRTLPVFFLLLFLIAACSGEEAMEEQGWNAVMELHDEVMPKMSDMNRISRSLRDYRDNHPEIEPQLEQRLDASVSALEDADEAMMDWMGNLQQLDNLRRKMSHEEIMEYIDRQEAAISTVRDQMLGALEQGRTLLRELGLEEED